MKYVQEDAKNQIFSAAIFLKIYSTNLEDFKEQQIKNPESQAVKNTARLYGTSSNTLRKILKEKRLYGDVKGSPYPRDTLTLFEKLTISECHQFNSISPFT